MQADTQKGAAGGYAIDKAMSRFAVQAFATGLLSAFGHNPRIEIRNYAAEIQCPAGMYDKASLHMVVQTAGMEVLDEMKRDDRQKLEREMYEKVLDVQNYPTAVYSGNVTHAERLAANLYKVRVNGELSFHGTTRPLAVEATLTIIGNTIRAAGEFSLRQSDYGIKPASFAAGTLRLKDEIKFTFDLLARQEEAADAASSQG